MERHVGGWLLARCRGARSRTVEKSDQDPTILFLRRGDGSFIVYGLSGGP